MKRNSEIEQFLRAYPGMSLVPSKDDCTVFKGDFEFRAQYKDQVEIDDSYHLKIEFPENFPKQIPKVWELSSKVPTDGNFHVNPNGTLCLGSPLHLLMKIYESPTYIAFAEECIVPFLYAVSLKKKVGGDFVMGELAHGAPGIIDDYKLLLGLENPKDMAYALALTSLRKRVANKKICPCRCGRKLGQCQYHYTLNYFRKLAPRSWFKKHLSSLAQMK